MSNKGSAHTIRVSTDAHEKLRTLAYMNDTSMTALIGQLVDDYMETGMSTDKQRTMWKIMSARVTSARERD